MKSFFILMLMACLCQRGFAQKTNRTTDEYFILGTLSDYMGRNGDPRIKNQVDYYYRFEKSLARYVDSLLKKDYPGKPFELKANRSRYEIYSAEISGIFDGYYDFVPTKSFTLAHEPILRGILKKDIFKNKEEKLAFLCGAYSRFSQDNDTAYCIRIANSASKAKVCYEILKELNCKVSYQILDYIPTGHAVYFHPDARLAVYLKKHARLKDVIKKDMQLFTDSAMAEAKRKRGLLKN